MGKTFKNFLGDMLEESRTYRRVNIKATVKKIKKQLPGNPYVDPILRDILKKSHAEDAMNEDSGRRQKPDTDQSKFFVRMMIRLWDGIQKDFDELMAKEKGKKLRKGFLVAKLATKACMVGIFLGVAIEELKEMAAGKMADDINTEKLKTEIQTIDSKIKEYKEYEAD